MLRPGGTIKADGGNQIAADERDLSEVWLLTDAMYSAAAAQP
jgi:hypothetical protein